MKRELAVWSGLILAIVLGGAATIYGPRLLDPKPAIEIPGDSKCDLHQGPCSVTFPNGGSMALAITPRPILPMKPMQMDVVFTGIGASKVIVDFKGVDMNMGLNRFTLRAAGDNRFEGQGIIPVCVRKRMLWDAWVIVDTNKGRYSAPFRFATTKE